MGKKYCGDISFLAGHIPEPDITNEVLAAARLLSEPFTLTDLRAVLDLPPPVIHRVLGRQVHKGVLTRGKCASLVRGWRTSHRRVVYAYRFAVRP